MTDFQFNAESNPGRRRKALLAGGVLALVGFGALGWHDWSELGETREALGGERLKLDRANAELAQTASVEDQVLLLRDAVQEYVKILPDDKEINAFVAQLADFAARSGVRVTKLDDDDAKARLVRAKKGAVAPFDKVAYKISAEGDAEQLLRFMDFFENHQRFVRVAALKIESAAEGRAGGGESEPVEPVEPGGDAPPPRAGAPHKIDLELETYVYNPKVRTQQPVIVPNEAQKLERLRSADGARADARKDLALASYRREPRERRRDVFYDPRKAPAAAAGASPEAKQAQEKLFLELKSKLDAVAAAAEKEAKETSLLKRLRLTDEVERGLAAFEKAFREAEEAGTITIEDLRKRIRDDLEPQFAKLAKGRDAASRRSAVAAEVAADALARMRASRDGRRYEEVVALSEDFRRRRTGEEPEAVAKMFAEAERLAEDARAELDFDARSFSFGGTVVYKDSPDRSVAIINGRPYMPGDRLDDETTVTAISASEVTFEFRGRKVVRAVKAGGPTSPPDKKAAGKPDRKKKV